ncbi:MAG: restriction endonuclease [Campylobacter sp.]|uniref:restriction endonuclease n=1 Tax=Campylobacter sp. TaxID=205 RepID=UPI002A839166|nr:restriction endonuclease [Campylobacter sp.]MCI7587614.1 restriction endonuclease [Campylobacter sp.]MDY5115878.1 restriction endonuclease [Campylobacter sp.]
MIKIFKTLLNIVLGLILWFFIMSFIFILPQFIFNIKNNFLSSVLGYAWLICIIGFVLFIAVSFIASNYIPKKTYSIKKGTNEVDVNLFLQDYNNYKNVVSSSNNVICFMARYSQESYYKYNVQTNEINKFLNKYKDYKLDNLLSNEASIKELKEILQLVDECLRTINFYKKKYEEVSKTMQQPKHTPPQSYEPPQPQLSKSERLLKEYEEKQYLKAEEIGRRYERYIGYLYEIDGYKVDYNGIKKGVKDGGVDLICSKRKELIIIQCKCRDEQGQIHENTILQLVANLMKYKRKYPNKNVSAVIYTSHDNLDDEAKATLADEVAQGALIHHIIKAYDNSYPKVKCNISDNGEKIYHIPDHSATYDRMQIEINKGEFFAKTIKEAESTGFRASKA